METINFKQDGDLYTEKLAIRPEWLALDTTQIMKVMIKCKILVVAKKRLFDLFPFLASQDALEVMLFTYSLTD